VQQLIRVAESRGASGKENENARDAMYYSVLALYGDPQTLFTQYAKVFFEVVLSNAEIHMYMYSNIFF
jgi:hypothetical protein